MDAQELRNLQEAYMEVYDNELGEGYKRFPYKRVEDKIHKKEAVNPTGRGTPQSVNMDKVFRHFKGEVHRTEKREHSPQISKAKEAENRARRTQKEQKDIYDNIPSHLFDEEKKPLPVDKMRGQSFAHRVRSNDKNISKSLSYHTRANRIDDTLSGKRKPQVSRGKYAERERENNRFSNRLMRSDKQGIRDSYDYYDIILSHLLDEGYAETPEAAEAIMVNMSEEWRDSIIG